MLPILRAVCMVGALSAILVGLVFQTGPALAHERRKVGKYELVVGFLVEPALLGQPNGISLAITNTETNQPVEGLQQTLKAEITYGGKTMPVSLRARFRLPGNYTADLIPTKVGTYAFRFLGDIEGLKVDERFESGPGTFNDVQGVAELQFPEKVPEASDMAARLQRAEAAAQEAENTARLLGGAAGLLGAVGIVLGLASLKRRGA